MKNATTDQLLLSDNNNPDDEIDLRQVVGALARRWRWITGGGAIGLLLSALNLFLVKPVFQGEFQIVLNQENSKSGLASLISENSTLVSLAGLSGTSGKDSIATEVQILNSPSVLRPIFEAVKANKSASVAKAMLSKLGEVCCYGCRRRKYLSFKC